jgi:hypothetical protein
MFTRLDMLMPLSVVVFATSAHAERPPEQRGDANLVVVGAVSKVMHRSEKFGTAGVHTHYSAEVKVQQVEHGQGVKLGDTLTVTWSHVTKRPSKPFPGAYGHRYDVKAGAKARFWLMDRGEGRWEIIYNADGVERLSR